MKCIKFYQQKIGGKQKQKANWHACTAWQGASYFIKNKSKDLTRSKQIFAPPLTEHSNLS